VPQADLSPSCRGALAAFANPDIYEFLEVEGMGYAIRLPANRVLQEKLRYLLKRPVGRPPHEVHRYYASLSYLAQRWKKPRRMVARVEWHSGELYPRVGFIVTNLAQTAERVVAFYNQRGTAEQWIKKGKCAIKWARLSCRSFSANALRLRLHALPYNLGNFMRTLAMAAAPLVADQPTREADQDRRQGGEPRPLRHVQNGRGRGATADVPGHPAADRPTAGTAGASMRRTLIRNGADKQREECALMNGKPRVSALPYGQSAPSASCLANRARIS
jgi:hypothetical protein